MPSSDDHDLPVAIVGAGFSGTLLVINLLRQGARVVLIERNGERLAKGQAFGTQQAGHLLNVRAANMGAYPDDPTHFQHWLSENQGDYGEADANGFAPRLAYGHYLHEQLMTELSRAPDRLRIVIAGAQDAAFSQGQVSLQLDNGEIISARALVLALGNLVPTPPKPLAGLSPVAMRANPWTRDLCEGLNDESHVLLIGTGLTAADVAISLDRSEFGGRITALSRRGLMPRAHAVQGPHVTPVSRPEQRGSWLLRHVRRRAAQVGWRHAVDELRPHTQSLWRLHDTAAQARVLRHLRPWWDVHRHRLAPDVARHLDRMITDGRLTVAAGRLVEATETDDHIVVTWRVRGGERRETLSVDRIILCTGPEGDITRCGEPLLERLTAKGLARPDPHRLGLDVDHGLRLIGRDGQAHEALFAVGPMTKGIEWEIVAVPDIRRQVWTLARALTNTRWVGGEGL